MHAKVKHHKQKKEFIRCFSISKRESKETGYWLNLITKLNDQFSGKISVLIKESNELTAIISKIIISTKSSLVK